MGIAVTGHGELNEANQWFSAALKLNPAFVPSLKNLAINEFDLNHLAKSEELLNKAARITPDDPSRSAIPGSNRVFQAQVREFRKLT